VRQRPRTTARPQQVGAERQPGDMLVVEAGDHDVLPLGGFYRFARVALVIGG